MGAYHSLDDVKALLLQQNFPLDFEDEPFAHEVERWIEQIEEVVNARLRAAGIETPVTDLTGIRVLNLICSNLTAARVWRVAVRSRSAEGRDYASELEQQAENLLKLIEEGRLLVTQVQTTDSPTASLGEDTRTFKVGEHQ